MPDIEPLTLPTREGPTHHQQDQGHLQAVCSGRCRTSALLNSPSPCVNDAITHIQEMKRLVENWSQQPHLRNYQSESYQENHRCCKPLRLQSADSDSDSAVSDLYVEGFAITVRESCQKLPLLKKVNDVLSEAMHLIERLEADRQQAEEALQDEKRKRINLETKVDNISVWRQTEHSKAVQKEHEACRRDIAQLKWKLQMETDNVDQVQVKFSRAKELNQRLQEDIEFATKQLPIVKENLKVQEGIINQIREAQAKAEEVCSKTNQDLLQAQREFKQMEFDAGSEKVLLTNGLTDIKNQLVQTSRNLEQLIRLEKDLLVEVKDAEASIALTEQKDTETTQQICGIVALEGVEKDRISRLNLEIEDLLQKNKELASQQIGNFKPVWDTEVSSAEATLQSKVDAFAAVSNDNLEYEQKLEDCRMQISKSEKAVKQMREEKKQMLRKISDNDKQWEKAREEMTHILPRHSVTQAKLEEQEQLTFMEEQRTRTEIKSLRGDLTIKMTALEMIKAQSALVEDKLKKQQDDSDQINQQLQKEFEESSSAANTLDAKIKNVKKLLENLKKLQSEHKEMLVNQEKENNLKCDQLKAAQDSLSATVRRYDITLGRIADLIKESENHADASNEMERNVKSMQAIVAELLKDLNVLESKNRSTAQTMSTLKSDIKNRQRQTQRFTQTPHLQARIKQMEDTKEALKKALIENKQLAKDYEGIQKILLEAREELVSAQTEKNHAQEMDQYYTKLSLFQKRMHKALEKYLQQRNLESLAELDRCQDLSQETAQKIKTTQEVLSEEVQHISAFLESLEDGPAADDGEENKQASVRAAGLEE
nr:coiled-coil domain-containing protein 178 [Nothobranchius furzeri]